MTIAESPFTAALATINLATGDWAKAWLSCSLPAASTAERVFCWPLLPTHKYQYIVLFGVCNTFVEINQYLFIMVKKTRGRPELADTEKRKPRFLLLLTDAEHELVQAAGKPKVSTWARETLVRAAKRQSKRD
jgi:hypothetical protein